MKTFQNKSGQQFEQEHCGCVGDDLFDILEERSMEIAAVKLGVYDGGSRNIPVLYEIVVAEHDLKPVSDQWL